MLKRGVLVQLVEEAPLHGQKLLIFAMTFFPGGVAYPMRHHSDNPFDAGPFLLTPSLEIFDSGDKLVGNTSINFLKVISLIDKTHPLYRANRTYLL